MINESCRITKSRNSPATIIPNPLPGSFPQPGQVFDPALLHDFGGHQPQQERRSRDFVQADPCPGHRLAGTDRQDSEKYSPLELTSGTDSISNPPGTASSPAHSELLRTRGAVQLSSVYLFEKRWKLTATSRQNIIDTRSPTREKYHLG